MAELSGGVIFDVDGTLLDTNYLHVAAWWEAFRERGHDIRCADVHRALGMGSADLVEQVLGRPDPSVIDAHSRYAAPYLGRMRPLPGAAGLLTTTAGLGLRVVLATSAKDEEVGLMLDALGAGDAISTVVPVALAAGYAARQHQRVEAAQATRASRGGAG
ncbi:MAG TPA: HAD family hydrolase [Streptosporangiaceae bacterium]|nr:HAD family hydrolase [Streptosporangiaceae bacterium]